MVLNGDVRPYGNSVVDTDAQKLYAFVMRDADKTTRFFQFAIPSVSAGTYSETYGCNVVNLESTDIQRQFDTAYFNYVQAAPIPTAKCAGGISLRHDSS